MTSSIYLYKMMPGRGAVGRGGSKELDVVLKYSVIHTPHQLEAVIFSLFPEKDDDV